LRPLTLRKIDTSGKTLADYHHGGGAQTGAISFFEFHLSISMPLQCALRGCCDSASIKTRMPEQTGEDGSMLTRIALLGCVLVAMPIASAQAQDRDGAKTIEPADGIFCTYDYSLSAQPGAATEPGKWWKTPHTMRVRKIECNGLDLGVADEDVDVNYRKAIVKTDLLGALTVIVSGGEHANKLEAGLTRSQLQKIKRLSWRKVLAAPAAS
jgi:hypothetical protein